MAGGLEKPSWGVRRLAFVMGLVSLSASAWLVVSPPSRAGDSIVAEEPGSPPTEPVEDPTAWPQFRGPRATGVAEGEALPVEWDVETGRGVRWRTAIEGTGHSSPVIFGRHVFVTSAVRMSGEPPRRRRAGDGFTLVDGAEQSYRITCIDVETGDPLWSRECYRGVPKLGIHPDASHASATPATDGRIVVAHFGSEGLYAYTVAGDPIWRRSFGRLASVAFDAPAAEYGFASSPVIEDGSVVLQCDVLGKSSLARLDAATGKDVWRITRRDLPGWATPTVVTHDGRRIILCNGHREIAAYDFESGERLWWTDQGGDIPIPTPVVSDGVAYFTSAHGPKSPVYAIRLEASGRVDSEARSSEGMVWGTPRGGAYIATPLVSGDRLYMVNGSVLKCVGTADGRLRFRGRLGDGTSEFYASPVAGDGKLYFPSRDGLVFVITDGDDLEVQAVNDMLEPCQATPAIKDGVIYVRTSGHLVAIGGGST